MRLKIGKKLKTASHNSKFTSSYKKESLCMNIVLQSNVDNSDNNLYILPLSRLRTNQPR